MRLSDLQHKKKRAHGERMRTYGSTRDISFGSHAHLRVNLWHYLRRRASDFDARI